ncbi:hypothetical protein ACFL49_02875 [Candidatus Omnitrophota bacterium]
MKRKENKKRIKNKRSTGRVLCGRCSFSNKLDVLAGAIAGVQSTLKAVVMWRSFDDTNSVLLGIFNINSCKRLFENTFSFEGSLSACLDWTKTGNYHG